MVCDYARSAYNLSHYRRSAMRRACNHCLFQSALSCLRLAQCVLLLLSLHTLDFGRFLRGHIFQTSYFTPSLNPRIRLTMRCSELLRASQPVLLPPRCARPQPPFRTGCAALRSR